MHQSHSTAHPSNTVRWLVQILNTENLGPSNIVRVCNIVGGWLQQNISAALCIQIIRHERRNNVWRECLVIVKNFKQRHEDGDSFFFSMDLGNDGTYVAYSGLTDRQGARTFSCMAFWFFMVHTKLTNSECRSHLLSLPISTYSLFCSKVLYWKMKRQGCLFGCSPHFEDVCSIRFPLQLSLIMMWQYVRPSGSYSQRVDINASCGTFWNTSSSTFRKLLTLSHLRTCLPNMGEKQYTCRVWSGGGRRYLMNTMLSYGTGYT